MNQATIDYERNKDELILHPRGRLDRGTVSKLWKNSGSRINNSDRRHLTMNLEEVTGMDSSGMAYLRGVENLCEERGISYEERNIPEHLNEFLRYNREHSSLHLETEPPSSSVGSIASVGLKVQGLAERIYELFDISGQFLIAASSGIRNPKNLHVNEILYQIQITGVRAVPLVTALSFLLGMLMVFQSSSSIGGSGVDIYVADMVVLAVTREMAPLMVAVAIAGRSGSAFAAEIGTMKLNEELDALTVMNIDVMRLIVLPRVFALAVAEPILTMIADLIGIFGGLVTAKVHMGVTALSFIAEAQGALKVPDILTGLIKSFTCGVITGFIACSSGIKATTGPESVGIQTTNAVVKSIFVVILIDTIYSYLFGIYGW